LALNLGGAPSRPGWGHGPGTGLIMCWWFAGSQPAKVEGREGCLLLPYSLYCMAGHFAQLLDINYLRLL